MGVGTLAGSPVSGALAEFTSWWSTFAVLAGAVVAFGALIAATDLCANETLGAHVENLCPVATRGIRTA